MQNVKLEPISPSPIKKLAENLPSDVKWEPLFEQNELLEARQYGHSFHSKKVAMGPSFINLRFMCHCLARAIKMHLDFNSGNV